MRVVYTLAFIAVVGCIVATTILLPKRERYVWREQLDGVGTVELWRQHIRSEGPKRAVEAAIESARNLSTYRDSHTAMHLIGSALYLERGNEGILYCKDESTGGCIHGFFTQAADMDGPGIISAYHTYCEDTKEPLRRILCAHGLGHVLVALGEYTLPELDVAVRTCSTLSKKPYPGELACIEGAVMEIVLQLGDDGLNTVQERNGNVGMWFPCDNLPEEYRAACYYSLPAFSWSWIRFSLEINDGALETMSGDCRSLHKESHRLACIAGVGKAAAMHTDTKDARVSDRCASFTKNTDEHRACVHGFVVRASMAERGDGEGWCAAAHPEEKESCMSNARFELPYELGSLISHP